MDIQAVKKYGRKCERGGPLGLVYALNPGEVELTRTINAWRERAQTRLESCLTDKECLKGLLMLDTQKEKDIRRQVQGALPGTCQFWMAMGQKRVSYTKMEIQR